jgi:hypothetical protein
MGKARHSAWIKKARRIGEICMDSDLRANDFHEHRLSWLRENGLVTEVSPLFYPCGHNMFGDRIIWLWRGLLAPVLTAVAHAQAAGGDASVDKSAFHLFKPTPSQCLRPMDTDGPGAAESPYTVDAGHFQIEMTFLAYAAERESFEGEPYEVEASAILPMILKVGLFNRLDVQLVLEPYNVVRTRLGANELITRGFGDTTLRLKYNVWGNDEGATAFAVMPYVKFPTSKEGLGNSSLEGGLILPLSVALPEDFWLGLTTRFDAVRSRASNDYHPEFINSIAVGHDLVGNLFGYVEFFSAVSTERDASWVGTFDTGLIYTVTHNFQLNAGVNVGLTRSADDWSSFFGMAWRF